MTLSNTDLTKKYKKISQREHVLLRPNMYVGSTEKEIKPAWIYNNDLGKMVFKFDNIYSEGLCKIINEAIDNAIDNVYRENPTNIIKVNLLLDENRVVVSNNGQHIPIEKHNGTKDYIPSVIFGQCLSGSNYDDKRDSIGMNGLGIKLANILSNEFEIEICDPLNKKFLIQKWIDGMNHTISEKPVVKKLLSKQIKQGMNTKVSFKPNVHMFSDVTLENIEKFINTRLIQISSTLGNRVKVYYNDKRIQVDTFKKYLKLFSDMKNKTIFHDKFNEDFEYGFMLSRSDTFEHQSFVNNLFTENGGTHTKFVTDKICKVIQTYFKGKANKNKQAIKLTKNNIMNKLCVFVSIRIKNPSFTSQTKTELSSRINANDFKIDEKNIIKTCKKFGILDQLEELLNEKAMMTINKNLNSSNKKSNVSIPKLDDAHDAGTSKSEGTMLFLTEGDSAKTMVSTGMTIIGRKKYGCFPLKGKMLNVLSCSKSQLASNTEIQNIMKILGLSLAKKYDNDEDIKSLRYSKVCILSDQDYDGFHIAGLFMNFISNFWPSLVERKDYQFLYRFVTPIIKITNKRTKKVSDFFNISDFEHFSPNVTPDCKIKYYKGLGTSTKSESIEYFKNMPKHLKKISIDEKSYDLLNMVFHPKNSDKRKEWLMSDNNENKNTLDYKDETMNMGTFIDTEVFSYSKYSIERAIPSIVDNFKVSQRKIMFTCLKKFGHKNEEFKVAQLGSLVASETQYAHGEQSLSSAIINLSQSFTGSNNLPLLEENGAFGSRLQNGNDSSSARYIYTCLRKYTKFIFNEEDDKILNYKKEENVSVEPDFYVPTIPMFINGVNGISTGFKTFVPNFNVDDIIKQCKHKTLSPDTYLFTEPVPYYKGFKGTIEPETWEMKGVYELDLKKKVCVISEIPVNFSLEGYKEKILDKLVENNKIGSYVIDHLSENEPRFILKKISETFSAERDLKLSYFIPRNNICFLNEHGCIKKYENMKEVLEDWFQIKIKYVKKRKEHLLNEMNSNLNEKVEKLRFLNNVVNGKIDIKSTKVIILNQCTNLLGFDKIMVEKFLSLPLYSINNDKIHTLEKECSNLKHDINVLENTDHFKLYHEDISKLERNIVKNDSKKRKKVVVYNKNKKKKNTQKINGFK